MMIQQLKSQRGLLLLGLTATKNLIVRLKPPHKLQISQRILSLLHIISPELCTARTNAVKGNKTDTLSKAVEKVKLSYINQMEKVKLNDQMVKEYQ